MNLSHSLLSHGGNNGGVNVNCGKKNKEKPISKLYRRGNKKDNPPSSSSSRARFSYTENHPTALHHTDDARNQQQQQQQQRWWLSSTSSWYYYSIPPSIIVGNSSLRQRRPTVGVEPLRLQQQCVYLLPPIRYDTKERLSQSLERAWWKSSNTREKQKEKGKENTRSLYSIKFCLFFFRVRDVRVRAAVFTREKPTPRRGWLCVAPSSIVKRLLCAV